MKEKILIVEDKFVEADYIRMMLVHAGFGVTGIAHSVTEAREMILLERPDFVLLDIFLKGKLTGIDLAKELARENIAFVFLSANSNEEVLNAAKATRPYGFLVKPFREKDLLVTLEIARYRHEHGLKSDFGKQNQDLVSNAKYKKASVDAPNGNTVFKGIVGTSPGLLHVFDLVAAVAAPDTSVLLLGESGTGKERIAECIHSLSSRKNNVLVKVNCATLPPSLIESELFGHEKGAFTGAMEKRIGKFEKADKGTIFLDEIGEMPVDLQAKLLRVLQEKYIERIGSGDLTKVDVRVIAATNRNLEKEVAEGRFRLDLYYRLNVFPILIPPLRERTEDLKALAIYFMNICNQKVGKKITGFSDQVLHDMKLYSWPGNIRELENLVERSVLLCKGTIIENLAFSVTHHKQSDTGASGTSVKTIHENERDYIVTILKKCNGRIWGPGGAADLLKIPPSTLKSKMKKLGIRKEYIE